MRFSVHAALLLVMLCGAPVAAADLPAQVQLQQPLAATAFDPKFPQSDGAWHGVQVASDGNVYFGVCTHVARQAAALYRLNPTDGRVELLGTMDKVAGEDGNQQVTQGKIHTPIFEYVGKLYTATHVAEYENGLTAQPKDRRGYAGGIFLSYDLGSGTFENLGRVPPDEGIIALVMDTRAGIMYGLTWPSALLLTCDVKSKTVRCLGPVQGRSEWEPEVKRRQIVCRALGLDEQGRVYGTTGEGQIWCCDLAQPRPVEFLPGVNLNTVDAQPADTVGAQWRALVWDNAGKRFLSVQHRSTRLFAFDPNSPALTPMADLRDPAAKTTRTHLGLVLQDGKLFHLVAREGHDIPGRPDAKTTLHLLIYDVEKNVPIDVGPIVCQDDRRVIHAESLALSPAGDVYTVAWVEVLPTAEVPKPKPATNMMLVQIAAREWRKALDAAAQR